VAPCIAARISSALGIFSHPLPATHQPASFHCIPGDSYGKPGVQNQCVSPNCLTPSLRPADDLLSSVVKQPNSARVRDSHLGSKTVAPVQSGAEVGFTRVLDDSIEGATSGKCGGGEGEEREISLLDRPDLGGIWAWKWGRFIPPTSDYMHL